MSRLTDYASKAPFMNVAIEIDGQTYKFNLDIQLKIHETKLTTELKEQPRAYAFLCMLRNKIIQQAKKKEKQLERKKNNLFIEWKAKTDKVTEATKNAATDKEVLKLEDELDTIKNLRSVLDICVNGFEQRKDLLQTLSSNLRTENKNS